MKKRLTAFLKQGIFSFDLHLAAESGRSRCTKTPVCPLRGEAEATCARIIANMKNKVKQIG